MTGEVRLEINRAATTDVRNDVSFFGSDSLKFSANRRNGEDARAEGTSVSEVSYGDDSFKSTAIQSIASDKTHFHWRVDLTVARDGKKVHERIWEKSFPRDMM